MPDELGAPERRVVLASAEYPVSQRHVFGVHRLDKTLAAALFDTGITCLTLKTRV